MRFTGTTVLSLKAGKIVKKIRLDDGVTALRQLALISPADQYRRGNLKSR